MITNRRYHLKLEVSDKGDFTDTKCVDIYLRTKENMYILSSLLIGGISVNAFRTTKYVRQANQWKELTPKHPEEREIITDDFPQRQGNREQFAKCKLEVSIVIKDGSILPLVFYFMSTEDVDICCIFLRQALGKKIVDTKVYRRNKIDRVWEPWTLNVLFRQDIVMAIKHYGTERFEGVLSCMAPKNKN